MLKKIVIIAVIAVILIGSSIAVYLYLKKEKPYTSNIIDAVPINTSLFFEIHDFVKFSNDLTKKNLLWNEVLKIPIFSDIQNNLNFLDSIIKTDLTLSAFFTNRPVTISVNSTGASKFDFLFLMNIPNSSSEDYLKQYISEKIKNKSLVSTRTYDKVEILDVKITNEKKTVSFSCTFHEGMFVFSFSSILVEDAIRQINSKESLNLDKNYSKVASTAGKNVHGNIYLNYKSFPKLLANLVNTNYSSDVAEFVNYSNWTEFDLNINSNSINMNGFSFSNNLSNNLLNSLDGQSPESFTVSEILPANTSFFLSLSLSDINLFYDNFQKYLDKNGKLSKHKSDISILNRKYSFDLEKYFMSNIDKEIALVYSDINSLNIRQDAYVVFKVKSKSEAIDGLQEIIKKVSKIDDKEFSSYIINCDIDSELDYPIFKLPSDNIPAKLFGKIFSGINSDYVTFIDNYMVFGSSERILSKIIHSNILQKTLDKDLYFNSFSENLTSKTNLYFYANISRASGLLTQFMNSDISSEFNKYSEPFQKIQSIAFQISSNKDLFYNNLFINFNPEYSEPPRTVWESHLDTITSFKPKLVINHLNDEKEIILQDDNNTLYLINSLGKVLWKKPIGEAILGDIQQIDCFKNKKFQFLFNTKSKLFIVDRNGNFVDRFPVILPSKATAPLAAFDYENSRDYRIFIPSEDRKIRVFSSNGDIITGWEFEKSETYVRKEIQHFRVEDKDFIVFNDSLKVYILDRKGLIRVKIKKQFAASPNNCFYIDNATKIKNARLISTDSSGTIMSIDFEGNVETLKLSNFTRNHFFDFQDVNADDRNDFIFVDENKLETYQKNKKEIFKYKFEENITLKPVYYYFAINDRKIGVSSTKTNEIFLFNSDGRIYEGFPLRGKTLFSIGYIGKSTEKFNLIVGSDLNYLYNYEVK